MWGGLTLAGSSLPSQWDREQDWKGKIKEAGLPQVQGLLGKAKRLQTFPFPLSCLRFYCWACPCGHSGSAALAAPSQIPVHPQPQWENQKRLWLFCPSSNPPVLSTLLWSQIQTRAPDKLQWRKWSQSQPNPVPCGVPQLLVVAACASCLVLVYGDVSWRWCLHLCGLKQILTIVQSSSFHGLVLQLARSWFMKNTVLCLCSWVITVTFFLINFVTHCWQKALFSPRISVTKPVWVLCRWVWCFWSRFSFLCLLSSQWGWNLS